MLVLGLSFQACSMQKIYHENGSVKEKGRMKKGTQKSYVGDSNRARCVLRGFFRHGKWTQYSPEGKKIGVKIYNKDRVTRIILPKSE